LSSVTDTSESRAVVAGLDRPLVAFFVLAYAIAWGAFGLVALVASLSGGVGATELFARAEVFDFAGLDLVVPGIVLYLLTRLADFAFSIAGVVIVAVTAGRAGLRDLFGRLVCVRIGWQWYAAAAIPVALYGLAVFVAAVGDDAVLASLDLSPGTLWAVLVAAEGGLLVTLLLRGPLGEELGLRGFALPRLQARTDPVHASLVIGVLWGLWHLPVLVGREPLIVVVFLLLTVGLSFVFTWLFNGSGGSLVPVLLFHTFQNSEEAYERLVPALVGTNWELVSTLSVLLLGFLVALVVRRSVRRSNRAAPGRH
jgi:membrane protease YdiL (CAAX protease family)